ncbi:MAG: hypothetical protein HY282_08560 [Nitrospirae bacterium]|nr:hypothetical protein [Candidatus Manganitrophaceae bacterium]
MSSLLGLLPAMIENPHFTTPFEEASPFFLLLILIAFYLYLSGRVIPFVFFSFATETRFNRSISKLDLMIEQNITICGRLKYVGDDLMDDPAPEFILEDATKNQIPIAPWLPLIAPLTAIGRTSEGMWDYLGKQLIIAGKIGVNRKKEKAVIPQLVVEVLP